MNVLLWVLQLLAALLYAASGWPPAITVGAAAILAVESLVFIGVHVKYRELPPIVMSAVLGLLMSFVAYGRLVLAPLVILLVAAPAFAGQPSTPPSTPAVAPPPAPTAAPAPAREKVLGFGGFFFRAKDPAALRKWYQDNLGIDPTPTSYEQQPWVQQAGETAFEPMPATTSYIPKDHAFMLNFRVGNLDAMVAQLRAAHVEVKVDPETYPNGRFAELADPEGNPIQLWEPATPPKP